MATTGGEGGVGVADGVETVGKPGVSVEDFEGRRVLMLLSLSVSYTYGKGVYYNIPHYIYNGVL